jgi:hypothetical protein
VSRTRWRRRDGRASERMPPSPTTAQPPTHVGVGTPPQSSGRTSSPIRSTNSSVWS